MQNLFLTVNKCITTVMIIIIINVKNFLERHFCGFQLTVLEIKRIFMKKAVLHTISLIHCKARQVLRDLLSTNQENSSEMAFVASSY